MQVDLAELVQELEKFVKEEYAWAVLLADVFF